jgi:hypothetical protein
LPILERKMCLRNNMCSACRHESNQITHASMWRMAA